MDLEVACTVILLGPSVRVFVALWPLPFRYGEGGGGVSLLVAFVLGVLVVAGDGLVVFLVAARGGRRVFPVGVIPPGCFVGSVAILTYFVTFESQRLTEDGATVDPSHGAS